MEASADGCPTGILIDFEVDTKDFIATKVSKGNKKDEVCTESLAEEEMNIISSHLGALNSIQNQNINPCLSSEKEMCHIPKSKWSTPSPQSMKIISHEVSRIIDKLSTSTDMLCDEVFPAIKSLDDGCFAEFHVKSENVPTTDKFTFEKVPENLLVNESISVIKTSDDAYFEDPHKKSEIVIGRDNVSCDKITENCLSVPEDMSECKFGRNNSLVTECELSVGNIVSSDCSTSSFKKQLTTHSESKLIAEIKQDFISEVSESPLIPENACKKESGATLVLNKNSNKEMINMTSAVVLNPTIEQTETLDDNHHEHEHSSALKVKPILSVSKGFGFKSSKKQYIDKNKENLMQQAGNKSLVIGIGLTKMGKASTSVEDGFKKLKISNKCIENKPIIECSRKSIATLAVPLENKKGKSVMNASQNYLPKEAIGKPSYKSNVQLPPFSRSKQPLCKSASMKLGTPNIQSVRRSNSFQTRRGKNSIPAVEEKSVSAAVSSCSRVLKPRMSLYPASNNEKGLSTLKFGANFPKSKSFNSTTTNPNRRASGIYFSSDIKAPAQNIRNSTLQNPVFSTSSRSRFSSRLDSPSPLPHFMNDRLARKLF